MNGWIKLHRRVLDNRMWQADPVAMHLFLTLLLSADSETGKVVTGRFQLADKTGIKPATVYKALLRLESTEMVTLTSNNKYTTVSICNWSTYQSTDNTTSNNKVTTRSQQSNNKVTLNKNKELRIKKDLDKSKSATPEFGNSEINELFAEWERLTGNKLTAQLQKNRYAARNLLKKHGLVNVKKMIGGVAYSHGEQYAPSIANFIQLQAKWDDLVVWGKRHKQSKGGFVAI